jgi:NAD(P)-dependent dehydrogenase (short-subunit alcohol dehydrogenase family)
VPVHQGNVGEPADCNRVVDEVMKRRGPGIGQANFAASKSGLFGLSQSRAREVARKRITANCVATGFIDTEMVAAVPEQVLARLLEGVPVGRLGQASEIARAVQFLVEDDAGNITGSAISVNGGLNM